MGLNEKSETFSSSDASMAAHAQRYHGRDITAEVSARKSAEHERWLILVLVTKLTLRSLLLVSLGPMLLLFLSEAC